MSLPARYKWLEDIGPLPSLVATGLQYLGLTETPGKNHNPVIMDMAAQLGLSKIYTNDELSWCAVYINTLIRLTGKKPVDPKGDKYNLLRALYLQNWGNMVPKGQEKLGDVLIFNRPGGGHVGLYIAETATTFVVLGGNQSNAVNFTEIKKSRLVAARNLYTIGPQPSVKKYWVNSTGVVSKDEA